MTSLVAISWQAVERGIPPGSDERPVAVVQGEGIPFDSVSIGPARLRNRDPIN